MEDRERDQAIVSRLYTIATRTWEEPTGQDRADRIAELAAAAGDRTDLMVEAAGIILGTRPPGEGDPRHLQHSYAAGLLLELAGVRQDAPEVREWVTVGQERRTRTRGPEPDRGW